MRWNKIFRLTLMTLIIVMSLLPAALVGATVETFEGSGQYIMSDFENPDIAKQRAQQKALQDVQKKICASLKTSSLSINDSEIFALTNNITNVVGEINYDKKIEEIDKQSIITWTATLTANIDTDKVYDFIGRDNKEKNIIVQQYKSLQDAIQKNDKQIENLKDQYRRMITQAERDRIRKQMDKADLDFLANQKLEEGNKLYFAGDYNGFIKLYDESLNLNANYTENYYYSRGVAYKHIEQYELAIQEYKKAIEFHSNDSVVYNSRANAYNKLKKYKQDIQDIEEAIQFNSNDAETYYNLGSIYKDFEQYEPAIRNYTKAIELNSNYLDAYNNRGLIYKNLGQYDSAIEDFNKVIQLEPNNDYAYVNRGNSYSILKQYEQAIDDYNKAIELNPNVSFNYYYLGNVYFSLQQYKRAITEYRKAINLNPHLSITYYSRGNAYLNVRQYKQAIKDYDKAIKLSPKSALAYYYRGNAYLNLKKYKQAIKNFDEAIKNYPILDKAYYDRGKCYQKLGDKEKAQADFDKAKEMGHKG